MIFKYSPRSLDPTGNRKIPLGKQGENKRMTLVFDVREWMDEYPEAELAVYVKPPEGEAYLAGIDKEQKGVYRWDITASDTAKAGEGMLELVMRDEATGTVHKSITAKTMIMPSISAEAPGDIPEAHVPWWERALALIEIGVSPEVVVTEIEGGHRVEITDEKGLHTFDVMDGVDGKDANKNLLDGSELNSLRMKEAAVSFRNAIALNAGTASYAYALAEGHGTASGFASHAEGYGTASGSSAHAEGMNTVASGIRSHAEGFQTVAASDAQHAQGKCNVEDAEGRYAHIVGNGRDIHNRSNAHTLDWDGNAWFAGDVYVGGKSQDDAEKLVKESAIPEVIEDALAQAKASGEFDGKDGAPGDPGADGFSPTVTLTRESDGVTIKATNKSGTSTAKVYDGKDGTGGGSGLPETSDPYQQLVTDADGNAVWEDKPFYEEIVEGDVLPETTVAFDPDAGGMGYVTEPYASYPTAENVYTVYWNGTPYECVAGDIEADGVPSVGLGNLAVFGGTETDDPFALVFVPRDVAESYGGLYCIAFDLSGASSATIRVTGTVSIIHPIDSKFIQSAKNSSIVNGSAIGSLRTIGSSAENENYTMGKYALAEGESTNAIGDASHAEGFSCEADGIASHAEGNSSVAKGHASHAEGQNGNAEGDYSHAEGFYCYARAISSHAEGWYTNASSLCQHVRGKYNIADGSERYSTIVGNGTIDKASNAHTLDWDGNAWYQGDIYVGGTSQDDGKKVATVDDIQTYVNEAILGGEW